MSSRVREKL